MSTATKSMSAFLRDPDLPFLETRDTRISGAPFGMHIHPTYSLSVVEEGSTMMGWRGGRVLVGAGTGVYLPPGEPHSCNPRPGATLKYRMFYFERDWFEERLAQSPPEVLDPARLSLVSDPAMAEAFLLFGRSLDAGANPAAKRELLDHALDMLLVSPGVTSLDRGQARDGRRAAILAAKVIAGEPESNLPLSELARACGLTPCHLTRVFRHAHGMTPHAYRNQLKVELAKRLLASGTPIAQAAVDSGFTDQSHLNRVFRRYAGATPRQYRLGTRD